MQKDNIKRAFLAALPRTLPVFAGYCFLGMTYGIYLNSAGLPSWFPIIMTLAIFSGSAEIIAVGLLAGVFDPVSAVVVSVMTGARYVFYGISMLDRYKGMGWKKFFLIYETVDETFSINFQSVLAPNVDRGWFYFFVSVLDHSYWIFGSLLGSFCGSLIKFDTTGLDFVVTAMFAVIFMNQWMAEKKHLSEFVGVFASLGCLLIFGAKDFLVPAMFAILALLALLQKPLGKMAEENEEYKIQRAKLKESEAAK